MSFDCCETCKKHRIENNLIVCSKGYVIPVDVTYCEDYERNFHINYALKPCPFCGNPAEVYDAEPYGWCPKEPVTGIRCSSDYCIGHSIRCTFFTNGTDMSAIWEWNKRKRKNKNTWGEDFGKMEKE